jgi:hypothetical protein
MTRVSSPSRENTGSSPPLRASAVRSRPYWVKLGSRWVRLRAAGNVSVRLGWAAGACGRRVRPGAKEGALRRRRGAEVAFSSAYLDASGNPTVHVYGLDDHVVHGSGERKLRRTFGPESHRESTKLSSAHGAGLLR